MMISLHPECVGQSCLKEVADLDGLFLYFKTQWLHVYVYNKISGNIQQKLSFHPWRVVNGRGRGRMKGTLTFYTYVLVKFVSPKHILPL